MQSLHAFSIWSFLILILEIRKKKKQQEAFFGFFMDDTR